MAFGQKILQPHEKEVGKRELQDNKMGGLVRHIPNALTCCNLLSGCVSVVMSMEGRPEMAAVMILMAAVFDFLDGFAARLLKVHSDIGGELDSLSDVVSFGVAPAFAVFCACSGMVRYAAFVFPVSAAVRLAKFNISSDQKTVFTGLPTPPAAILAATLPLCRNVFGNDQTVAETAMVAIVVLLSALMVSKMRFFSLKVKNLKWNENRLRYVLVAAAVVFVLLWKWAGVGLSVLFYIMLSLLSQKRSG